jgi:hypothetical protein
MNITNTKDINSDIGLFSKIVALFSKNRKDNVRWDMYAMYHPFFNKNEEKYEKYNPK